MQSVQQNKAGKLDEDLTNNYSLGSNKYPETLTEAVDAIIYYRNVVNSGTQLCKNKKPGGNNNYQRKGNNDNYGIAVSFAQGKGNNKSIKCFKCGEEGHIASKCTSNKTQSGASNAQSKSDNDDHKSSDNDSKPSGNSVQSWANFQIGLTNVIEEYVNHTEAQLSELMKSWVLLDNQSTTDIFCDATILEDIKTVDSTLKLHSNGGVLETSKQAILPEYGRVWYSPKAITNILSLSNVKKQKRVRYDSENGDVFKVMNGGSNTLTFKLSKHRLLS